MKDRPIIRPANQSDTAEVRELRLEALKLHPDSFGADYQASANLSLEEWQVRCSDKRESTLRIATVGGTIVGMAGIQRGSSPKSSHNGRIWGVYVKAKHRGNGIGAGLVTACMNWAVDNELLIVKLSVVASNKAAIKCYEQCGFRQYGIEPMALLVGGKSHDEVLMACDISHPS